MKLQLRIDSGTLAGRLFDLETGFLTIGRSATSSVRFDPETERIASKQHCFIEARPDGFYITDNNSTNGTFVNGQQITTQKLDHGDQLQFGRNGTTGQVAISGAPAASQDQYRDMQSQQFHEAAATNRPSVALSLSNIGLGRLETKPPESRTGFYVGLGIAGFLAIPLILIVIGIMFLSLGPVSAIVAAIIAFTPAALYILPLIAMDRYDPEPVWLLALLFGWGALVSVIVAFVLNTVFGVVVYAGTHSEGLADLLGAVISAPVVEEGMKGLGVLAALLFFRKYFDDVLDGIVFAGVIALGFATVENVLYYGNGINSAAASGGLASFLLLFVLRGILSPFAHVTFTSMTGIGCGISRESHNGFVKFVMPVVGYFGAVTLHAIWNGLGFVVTNIMIAAGLTTTCRNIGLGGDNIGLCGFFTGYLVLEVPLFLILLFIAWRIMRRQRRILNEMLALDVARGLIPEEHAKIATSAFKSTSWLASGLFGGKYLARSRYLRAIGKLGLSYWHIQRATVAHGQTASFQQNPLLRDEVLRWREAV
ncbi:MAG: PrsW family intramembrane metalloprotease [Acidobacteria bacterium]|nr:PrsW family intramembrane metalloprotease [Acidobacteriota bacterium]